MIIKNQLHIAIEVPQVLYFHTNIAGQQSKLVFSKDPGSLMNLHGSIVCIGQGVTPESERTFE